MKYQTISSREGGEDSCVTQLGGPNLDAVSVNGHPRGPQGPHSSCQVWHLDRGAKQNGKYNKPSVPTHKLGPIKRIWSAYFISGIGIYIKAPCCEGFRSRHTLPEKLESLLWDNLTMSAQQKPSEHQG